MRPYSADHRNITPSKYPKHLTHKKDKYSFNQSPRFLYSNANTLQYIEGSNKKVDYNQNKKINSSFCDNIWANFYSNSENNEKKTSNIRFSKNKSNISDNYPKKEIKKRGINMKEFEKNLSKASLNANDPKIENLKKTIFSNYSNHEDYININYKRNFNTENKQEYISHENQTRSQFSHLLFDYKLGNFERKTEKNEKISDLSKKSNKQSFGKRPEFITDLQKPTFYMFTKSDKCN